MEEFGINDSKTNRDEKTGLKGREEFTTLLDYNPLIKRTVMSKNNPFLPFNPVVLSPFVFESVLVYLIEKGMRF